MERSTNLLRGSLNMLLSFGDMAPQEAAARWLAQTAAEFWDADGDRLTYSPTCFRMVAKISVGDSEWVGDQRYH
jgi:hypothetical protein